MSNQAFQGARDGQWEQAAGAPSLPQNPAEMLAAMANMYRYEMPDLEAVLWVNQVFNVYPPKAVMRALLAHMEAGTADSNFMPKYGAIKKRLEPTRGFVDIVHAVSHGSPYVAPESIKDPVLIQAIHEMGGWGKVCAEMPDGRERPIDFDRYMKRFDAAITAATAAIQVRGAKPQPLIGISQQSGAPKLAAPAPLAIEHDSTQEGSV